MRHFTDLFWLVLFSSAVLVMFVGLPFSWSEWRKELSLAHNARLRVVVTAGVVSSTEKENSLEGRGGDYTQAKEGTMTGDAG
jgi:hypothetical protein